MALFVTKEGKRKSPMAVTCFFVDLLFCLVFGGMYALLTGVLHDHLPLGGHICACWTDSRVKLHLTGKKEM